MGVPLGDDGLRSQQGDRDQRTGRRFDGWQPNQAWVADITYIPTGEGWPYLACVLDLASRRIVGWSMADRMKAELVCTALKAAYWQRKPGVGLIMHTDRGSQYATRGFPEALRIFRLRGLMAQPARLHQGTGRSSALRLVGGRTYKNTATFTLKRSASFLANCLLISRLPFKMLLRVPCETICARSVCFRPLALIK